jgi:hypothetical protein
MRTSGPRLSSDVAAGRRAHIHQWESNYLNERRSPTHQQQHSVHSAGGEVTVGEPQQSQSGRYLSTPALRHWEAPRRTTVDARNQPADKRMTNRRLKPHRRPCAPLVGKQTLWVSPGGERSLLPQPLTTDIRGDSSRHQLGRGFRYTQASFGAAFALLALTGVTPTVRPRHPP